MSTYENIVNELSHKLSSSDSKDNIATRKHNINVIANLPRDGLEHLVVERRLLLYTTECGEKIYIQYPGKETKNDASRPWDMRPKIVFEDLTEGKDLSFKDVWDDLSELNDVNSDSTSVLGALFYKLANGIDYKLVKVECPYYDFDRQTGKILNKGTITLEWYKPYFSKEVYYYLENTIGHIRNMSIEAYVLYNDLLGSNEDAKYFYRDEIVNGKEWKGDVGKRNTFLTHLNVLLYIQGKVRFTTIMDSFQRGRGVAPIRLADIPSVTNNIINKQ